MFAQSSNSFGPLSFGTPHARYDVFLSFRGEDVRGNFLEYLYRALRGKGISTFKDDYKLRDGENIKDGLLEAIEESSSSIVVLSKNYANSSWCLKELVHILECKRTNGHVVYPIFYHVTPSEVRKQEGAFGEGFAQVLDGENIESRQWREALEEVGNLKGRAYPSSRFENEANLIDELVHRIFDESIKTYRNFSEGLVGIKPRMLEVIKLLDLGSEKPRVVGLWGMGGIGKTTLAKAVYEAISWQFEGCSLIEDVRETSERSGVIALQKQLISDILMEEKVKISNSVSAMDIIIYRVCRLKVLIVLDDVDESIELENLVGKLHWFSSGSRLIITTRDKHILTVYGAQDQDIFKVQELNNDEAIQLFKSKAFVENGQTGEFQTLINRAVIYANGVPLALKILGSFLLGRTFLQWESALDRLRESPHDKLQQVLRTSYDGLHWTEKKIFLDISCFLKNMDKSRVVKILDSCHFNPIIGIDVLVRKSLLTLSVDDKLQMHDLVQQMGWSIVDEESREEPGERSRLWRLNDIKDVIMQNSGTKKVEGVWPENIQPRSDAFAKMTNLRFLCIDGVRCYVDLPNKLRILIWDGFPLKCMPSTFQPEHLVELCLKNSRIEQLWDRRMALPKLISLDLKNSTSLIKCPDFTGFPSLEYLELEGCTALLDLHLSITKLKKLSRLNLEGCESLQNLPYRFESQCLEHLIFSRCVKLGFTLESFEHLERLSRLSFDQTGVIDLHESIGNCTDLCYLDLTYSVQLQSIPRSIGQLRKLKELILWGCSRLSILPEEVGLIDSLEVLQISYSGVGQLPDSVARLRNLRSLECRRYRGTPPCFSGFEYLEHLDISCCSLTSFPESVSFCTSLKILKLTENDFEYIPPSIKNLCNLECLLVDGCKRLQGLPELPSCIQELNASYCESLKTIGSSNAYKDACKLWFLGCSKLAGNDEISIIMGYNFLFNQKIGRQMLRSYVVPVQNPRVDQQ